MNNLLCVFAACFSGLAWLFLRTSSLACSRREPTRGRDRIASASGPGGPAGHAATTATGIDAGASARTPRAGHARGAGRNRRGAGRCPQCGPPPYQMVRLAGARHHGRHRPARPGRRGRHALNIAREQKFATGADGRLVVLVTREPRPGSASRRPGYLPWMVGELIDWTGTCPPAALVATLVPDKAWRRRWCPGCGRTGRSSSSRCRAGARPGRRPAALPEGVALSVKDHPDATVLYRASGATAATTRRRDQRRRRGHVDRAAGPWRTRRTGRQKPGCSYTLLRRRQLPPALPPIRRTPLAARGDHPPGLQPGPLSRWALARCGPRSPVQPGRQVGGQGLSKASGAPVRGVGQRQAGGVQGHPGGSKGVRCAVLR